METLCKDRTSTVTMKREGGKSMLMTVSSTGAREKRVRDMAVQMSAMCS